MRKRLLWMIPVLATVSASASSQASNVTIDFDSLPGMTNLPGTIVPTVSQLSDQFLTSLGVSFRSQVDYVAVVVHRPPNVSEPNVIGGVKSNGEMSYGTPITISFFDPLNPTTKASTDFVQIRGDPFPLSGATATMEVFNAAGQSLGSVTEPDITGGLTLSMNVAGIHSVLLTQDSGTGSPYDGTIGFDNLEFHSMFFPVSYCTAKTNSCGTDPAISSTGSPTAASTTGFVVSASNAKTGKFGLLVYTDMGRKVPAAPFGQGGWLCLDSPVRRGPALQAIGGTAGQCDATFDLDVNCFAAGLCGGNPQPFLSVPGTVVNCQWWGRDNVTHGSYLSDALQYTVLP